MPPHEIVSHLFEFSTIFFPIFTGEPGRLEKYWEENQDLFHSLRMPHLEARPHDSSCNWLNLFKKNGPFFPNSGSQIAVWQQLRFFTDTQKVSRIRSSDFQLKRLNRAWMFFPGNHVYLTQVRILLHAFLWDCMGMVLMHNSILRSWPYSQFYHVAVQHLIPGSFPVWETRRRRHLSAENSCW